jgi:hypothetical protein
MGLNRMDPVKRFALVASAVVVGYISYVIYFDEKPKPALQPVPVCCELPIQEPAPVVLHTIVVREPTWADSVPEFAQYKPVPVPVEKHLRRHRRRIACPTPLVRP